MIGAQSTTVSREKSQVNGTPPRARLASKFHSACSKAAIRTSNRANAVKDHTTVNGRWMRLQAAQGAVHHVSRFAPDAFRHYTAAGEKWAMIRARCEANHCALVQCGAAWGTAIPYAWGREAIMLGRGYGTGSYQQYRQ